MDEIRIKQFLTLSNGSGDGSGDGDGSGYGSGSGSGSGYGSGYGSGDGYGDGSGSGDGYGYGSGYGDGSGDGSGSGSGDGYGDGSGDGDGYGDGYGSGDGYGDGKIVKFKNQKIYIIDDTPTIIHSIHSNVARGEILNQDFTTTKCYVVKNDRFFAHGETITKAIEALNIKIFDGLDVDEKIDLFIQKFEMVKSYPAKTFFDWHNKLTGSCEMGRLTFINNHNIDLMNDSFTVKEFIELTRHDYGGNIIQQLEDRLKKEGKL